MSMEVKTWIYRSQVDGTEVMIPLGKDSTDQDSENRLAFFVKNPRSFKLVEVISLWPSSLYTKGES